MKRFSILLFFLLFSSFLPCIAQDNGTDSLKLALKKQNEDTTKVNLLNQITTITIQSEDAFIYGNQAVKLATKLNFSKGKALGLKNLGLYYFIKSDFIPAEEYWREALEEYTVIHDESGRANMLNNLGSIKYNMGNLSQAMEFFFHSL